MSDVRQMQSAYYDDNKAMGSFAGFVCDLGSCDVKRATLGYCSGGDNPYI